MSKIIVYPPTIRYKEMYQTPQHILKGLSERGYTVYFCEGRPKRGRFLDKITPTFFTCQNYEKLKQKLKGQRVTIYNSWSRYHDIRKDFNVDFHIYHYLDDFPEWEKDQNKIMKDSDVIFCTAESLYQEASSKYPEKAHRLSNGSAFKHFNSAVLPLAKEVPEDLPIEGRKSIVYYHGAIAHWMDCEMIDEVAKLLPDINFVFVGKNFGGKLQKRNNIFDMGHKDFSVLPNYLAFAEVCIIPFKINRITLATNPIKVYEYFAAGKPVVTSPLPELKKYAEVLYFASTPEEFASQIQKAINEKHTGKVNQRIGIAQENSWDNKVNKIIEVIGEKNG